MSLTPAPIGSTQSKIEYRTVDSVEGSMDFLDAPDENKIIENYCRKVDRRILLYAVCLCILNQSDRGSIGVAKVVGLEKDLGMEHNDFNIAATLFTVGYLSLEFFSNFLLKKVGASRLLPTLGILWGIVCTLQGVITTKAQLFVMRVLLGMSECGFTAGMLLIISFYYPKSKLTARVGYFYLSSPIANCVSGPLASALSHINHPTIKRWQWVFLLEGIITIAVSILGYFILQDHPEKCTFLTSEEKRFIIDYKRNEKTLGGSEKLSMHDTKNALMDWQLWCQTLATLAICCAGNSVTVFAPELINELGFTAAQAQAMSALPSVCGAIAIFFAGSIVRWCGGHWRAGVFACVTALVGSLLMACTLNVPVRIIGLCLLGTGGNAGLGVLPGWNISANSKTVAHSAVASGMTVFLGSSSSFISSNIFLNSDAPRFLIGHLVNAAMMVVGICACVVVRISMGKRNRRLDLQPKEIDDGFRYVY